MTATQRHLAFELCRSCEADNKHVLIRNGRESDFRAKECRRHRFEYRAGTKITVSCNRESTFPSGTMYAYCTHVMGKLTYAYRTRTVKMQLHFVELATFLVRDSN